MGFDKKPLHTVPLWLGILCKAGLIFLSIFSYNLFFDFLIIGLFKICLFMDQSWTNQLEPYIQNWKDLGSNSNLITKLLVALGSSSGQIAVQNQSGGSAQPAEQVCVVELLKRGNSMLSYHSCHIYGTWWSIQIGEDF